MSKPAKAAMIVVGIVLVSLFSGVVLSILWGWFVEPLGLPHIGIAEALGLSTTIQLMTVASTGADDEDPNWAHADDEDPNWARADDEDPNWAHGLLVAFVRIFAGLAFGFIYHLFMV